MFAAGLQASSMLSAAVSFAYLEHDPEKWAPVFGKDHAPNKNRERDDRSHESRPALARRLGANAWRPASGYRVSTVSRVLRLAAGSAAGGAAGARGGKARCARRARTLT